MIYPKEFEEKIGFTPLRQLLLDNCETRLGKEEVINMTFSDKEEKIKFNLDTVKEMVTLIQKSELPLETIHDIIPWLKEIKTEGSYLSGDRLSKISATLETMHQFSIFFGKEKTEEREVKTLSELFSPMPVFNHLRNEIDRCVDPYGELKDNASPVLKELRDEIRRESGSVQRTMQHILSRAISNGIVEKDVTPVVRNGRLVLPVAAGNKKNLSGIVQDMSATGRTIYIEPIEVVEAGNKIRKLESEEQQEIINILINLASLIRPEIGEIIYGCKLLAKYDFIKAKAKFAINTGGELPHINKNPELEWYHAVHPGLLLNLRKQNKTPEALYIHLDADKRILIISGPNAGGKSVCLKTVATVQYLMQCGMLPSLHSNSHMGIFNKIFIDIGDEQSIENDLSTYSSHLANMKYFLNHADKKTLILADEMGSGTEPQIGGALAQSILEQLGKSGCYGVVTTHYQNLKTFAEKEPGFVNGAMLYDRQHLQPTFKLSIGHPGSSFALDIARKIGLPMDVINSAKNIVGSEYIDLDKYLLDIQRDRKYWENKRLNIKEKENKLNRLLETYEKASSDIGHQKNIILKAAKEEARDILSEANSKIENVIHEIRKSQAEKEKTKSLRKELEEYKIKVEKDEINNSSLKPLKHKSRNKPKGSDQTNNKDAVPAFEVGSYVKLKDGGVTGQILSIEGNKAEIAFGQLRSKADLSKLILSKKPKESVKSNSFTISSNVNEQSRERQLKFKNEIDVRGMRADEALQAVTYFLDDATQFNIGKLRILHGTGHGILKTLIRQQLKSNPNILNFYDEDVRFGGAGITVVEL